MTGKAWIVTAIGNEAPYLLEWVAHYRSLGFAGAVIFTSGSEDGSDAMAARLQELGHARHVPLDLKRWRNPLNYALQGLLPLLDELRADWAMVADIAEFLVPRGGAEDLPGLLAALGPADAISVCRRPFGSAGHRGLPEGMVRASHLQAAGEKARGAMPARGIRTLFRPGKVARLAPHRPYFPADAGAPRWLDAGGQPMPEGYLDGKWTAYRGFSHRFARLNYYATPSPETFLLRRGLPDTGAQRDAVLDAWRALNAGSCIDDGIFRVLERSEPLVGALNEDAVLARLAAEGRAWHEARIEAMLQDDALRSLCEAMACGVVPEPAADEAPAEAALAPALASGAAQDPPETPADGAAPKGRWKTYSPPPVRPIRFKVAPSPDGESHAVLHGGFHKTATTHIQKLLEHNKKWLGRQSIYVVPHQKLRKHITIPTQFETYRQLNIPRRTRVSEAELRAFSEAFFAELVALRPRRIILSDENLPGLPGRCVDSGRLYHRGEAFFESFARRIPFPVREAFFAVRGYADFFASAYVEYLRAAMSTTKKELVTPEQMRQRVLANLSSWREVLAGFAEVFPDARIHVWRFEDFGVLKERVLQRFCGEGIDIAKLEAPHDKARTRPGASARAVEELVLIAQKDGMAAMAGRVREMQDRFPLETGERFDPWEPGERAHLDALYARDWAEICADPRFEVMHPGEG